MVSLFKKRTSSTELDYLTMAGPTFIEINQARILNNVRRRENNAVRNYIRRESVIQYTPPVSERLITRNALDLTTEIEMIPMVKKIRIKKSAVMPRSE